MHEVQYEELVDSELSTMAIESAEDSGDESDDSPSPIGQTHRSAVEDLPTP